MVLFWCLRQCWIRWIDFYIGKGKKGILETDISWTRVYTLGIENFPPIWVSAKGIYELQNYQSGQRGIYDLQNYQSGQRVYMMCKIIKSGQWVYMICKIINLGNGYIWFAKLSIWAKKLNVSDQHDTLFWSRHMG